MRDAGLNEAIRAVAVVGALARRIGISQPSISNWPRVLAERVLSVEAATGIDCAILRPDLYAQPTGSTGDVDEIDGAHPGEYALLSVRLARAPDADLLCRLARLGIERAPGQTEPEDHAATLCEIMAGLVGPGLSAPPDADRELFETHLAPRMGGFFADLEGAHTATFYRSVGRLSRVFMEIESEGFALSA